MTMENCSRDIKSISKSNQLMPGNGYFSINNVTVIE